MNTLNKKMMCLLTLFIMVEKYYVVSTKAGRKSKTRLGVVFGKLSASDHMKSSHHQLIPCEVWRSTRQIIVFDFHIEQVVRILNIDAVICVLCDWAANTICKRRINFVF